MRRLPLDGTTASEVLKGMLGGVRQTPYPDVAGTSARMLAVVLTCPHIAETFRVGPFAENELLPALRSLSTVG